MPDASRPELRLTNPALNPRSRTISESDSGLHQSHTILRINDFDIGIGTGVLWRKRDAALPDNDRILRIRPIAEFVFRIRQRRGKVPMQLRRSIKAVTKDRIVVDDINGTPFLHDGGTDGLGHP